MTTEQEADSSGRPVVTQQQTGEFSQGVVLSVWDFLALLTCYQMYMDPVQSAVRDLRLPEGLTIHTRVAHGTAPLRFFGAVSPVISPAILV